MPSRLIPLLFRRRRKTGVRRRRRQQLLMRPLTCGDKLFYLGQPHRLLIVHSQDGKPGCALAEGTITVTMGQTDLSAAALLEELRLELRLWYKKEARHYIAQRLNHWAKILNVTYSRCLITGPISLWGSCNSKNEIRINWRIMMAAPELIDYLLAHELCHVVHKDHSPYFWGLLTSVMPDCKERRRQLRAIGPSLFSQQG